jgi:chromosome segregation ATPase
VQEQSVNKQVNEVTELLNSYQQKASLANEEISLFKQQIMNKDKELEQLKIQLKNLKRSRSTDNMANRQQQQQQQRQSTTTFTNTNMKNLPPLPSNKFTSNDDSSKKETIRIESKTTDDLKLTTTDRKLRSSSVESSGRQIDIVNDEMRLLKNKIARLEDDLSTVTTVSLLFINQIYF